METSFSTCTRGFFFSFVFYYDFGFFFLFRLFGERERGKNRVDSAVIHAVGGEQVQRLLGPVYRCILYVFIYE